MRALFFRSRIACLSIVFVVSFLVLALLMDRNIGVFDEGLVLVDAMRTLAGDVVHRDYHSPYGPGSYALLAALFSITTPSLGVARAFGLLVMAGIVTATFSLLVTRTRPMIYWTFTGTCAGWMTASNYYLYPLLPCVLLTLVGGGLLLAGNSSRRTRWRVLAGCCTGMMALFRYDAGFVVMMAQLGAVGMQEWRVGVRSSIGLLRAAIPLVAGISVVFIPVAAAYLAVAPLSSFAQDVIDYPLRYYAEMRGIPFPRLQGLLRRPHHIGVYMPFAALLLTLIAFMHVWRTGGASKSSRLPIDTAAKARDVDFVVLFALLAALGCYKSAVRPENIHMLLAIIPAGLVMAVLTDRAWTLGGRARIFAALAFTIGFVPAGLAAGAVLTRLALEPDTVMAGHLLAMSQSRPSATRETLCPMPTRIRGGILPADYVAASRYLLQHSAADEPIFVGLSRHDKTVANAVVLYFAAERQPGTRWHQFDPGLQTRAEIQQSMITDLQRNQVRWVVRDRRFEDVQEPNGSSRSSGVFLLDRWLDANYRVVAHSPSLEIWLANSVAPPPYLNDPCMPQPAASAYAPSAY